MSRRLAVAILVLVLGAALVLLNSPSNGTTRTEDSAGSTGRDLAVGRYLATHGRDRAPDSESAISDAEAVDLERRGIVTIQVVDARQRPLGGRLVRVVSEAGSIDLPPKRTDAKGVAILSGAPPSVHSARVEVEIEPGVLEPAVTKWGYYSASAEVGFGSVVGITVRDERGQPVQARVEVSWRTETDGPDDAVTVPPPSRTTRGRADASGSFRLFVPRQATTAELEVSSPEHAEWREENWVPRDTEVRLDDQRSLHGVVLDGDGRVRGEGTVAWTTPQGVEGEVAVAWDGTFVIDGLPHLPITLSWGLPEAPLLEGWNRREGMPGSGVVSFVVDLRSTLDLRVENWPAGMRASLHLTPEMGDRTAPVMADVDPTGRALFRGLPPGTPFVVWMRPESMPPWDGPSPGGVGTFLKHHVRPAERPVEVRWIRGRTATGLVETVDLGSEVREAVRRGELTIRVGASGLGWDVTASIARDSSSSGTEIPFLLEGLPEEASLVEAHAERIGKSPAESARWAGAAVIPPDGGPMRIRLRPVR